MSVCSSQHQRHRLRAIAGLTLPGVAALLFILAGPAGRAQTPTVTTLARLGGDPNGFHPQGQLVDGHDGFFYGTTVAGGPANLGTVFKVALDGTLTTLHVFSGDADGQSPETALVAGGDGNFYGTTPGTFTSNFPGTVFRITPAGVLTTIYRFSALDAMLQNSDGAFPASALTLGSDGYLYGTTYSGGKPSGGVAGRGTIYRITLAGALTTLANFNFLYSADPQAPLPAFTQGTDGNFYGVTPYGDPSGAGYGLVFQVTPGGTVTPFYRFAGGADGSSPEGSLTIGPDGNFYGTTTAGGANGQGTFFRLTPAGQLTTLHSFTSAEGRNAGTLTLAGGNLYGTTSQGGAHGYGTVFQVTFAGSVIVEASFSPLGGRHGGSFPNGLLLGGDGNFYGTTEYTGNADAGLFFKMTPGGTLTTPHLFTAGGSYCKAALAEFPNGVFYGVTQQGGAFGAGTIFGVTTSGVIQTVHNFNADTEGKAPGTRLVPDGTGNYYGSCDLEGPNGGGTIYLVSLKASSKVVSEQSQVSLINGASPLDLLSFKIIFDEDSPAEGHTDFEIQPSVLGRDALKLIFATPIGAPTYIEEYTPPSAGSSSSGRAFATPGDVSSTGGLATLYTFTGGTDGSNPLGGVVTAMDGNYYGTTSQGGAGGQGTVFSLTPDGVLTTLHAFAGTGDGAQPQAGLIVGADGNFYGTTGYGSFDPNTFVTTGSGTIFKITPAGVLTTIHTFANDRSEGVKPAAALLQASDGNFYGTTSAGGALFGGTVFSLTPSGTFTTLYSFGEKVGDGGSPVSALIQGSDGNLYGTTSAGGTDNSGVVFRVTLPFHVSFFSGEAALSNGVYYLSFPTGNPFGYYSYLSDPHYIYHFDLGYEYVFEASDGHSGVYFYDFKSNGFFYTSPSFPFPYLYDFSLNSVVYYYPDPSNLGRYNTDGYRFFYVFDTGQIITK